jgi:hypothetical protein
MDLSTVDGLLSVRLTFCDSVTPKGEDGNAVFAMVKLEACTGARETPVRLSDWVT